MVKMMNSEEKIEHELFDVSILLKGIHALVEIVGGMLAYFISSDAVLRFAVKITQGELLEDPNDYFTKYFLELTRSVLVGAKQFVVFYLLSHGIINLLLVVGLFRKRLWAYHASFVVFTLFATYQMYRYFLHPSIFMVLLTLFDIVAVWLIWREYLRIKKV